MIDRSEKILDDLAYEVKTLKNVVGKLMKRVNVLESEHKESEYGRWISVKDALPISSTPYEYEEYLCLSEGGYCNLLMYCDGWNCSYYSDLSKGINKENEIKDIIAWMKIPKFEGK